MDGFCTDEEKLLGPLHEYVAPAIAEAVRFNVEPAHTGELDDAVGAAGVAFTVTAAVPAALVQPFTVTVNEYVPVAAVVAAAMVGFCSADEKLFGPVQLYVAPATAVVVNVKVLPEQIGLLLPGAGVAGIGLTVTTVVPAALVHPPTLAVTEYVPVAATVAPAIDGFCTEEEKLLGPVHEYVAPATGVAVNVSVDPAQTGLLLEAVGAAGVVLTVTATVPARLVQPPTVTVTE